MNIQKLLEFSDKEIRETLGDYLFISKSRLENLLTSLREGSDEILKLTEIIDDQRQEIAKLHKLLYEPEMKIINEENFK